MKTKHSVHRLGFLGFKHFIMLHLYINICNVSFDNPNNSPILFKEIVERHN